MPKENSTIIAIIGAGNVGTAFAQLFSKCGFAVVIGARNPAETREKIRDLLPKQSLVKIESQRAAVRMADINLLTVPDNAITSVCDSLALDFRANSIVAHCSGALDSLALGSAKQVGCSVCSLHPLNTFPSIAAALQLLSNTKHKTYLYCEGDRRALDITTSIFKQFGFRPVEINRISKPLYHAACVIACNYFTALIEVSLQTAEAAELDRQVFWQSLQPLLQSTLNNINDKGTVESLSGPIARADSATINKHLQELAKVNLKLKNTYADLGRHALALAIERGALQPEAIDELKNIFEPELLS